MTNDYSLADIKAVTDGNGNNGDFMGNNGAWWIILFLLFGWGRGGWGGYGDNGGGIGQNYALTTDMATLERKIDGVYSGICDSTYALNNGIQNGFAAAQNTMAQGFAGLNTALVQQTGTITQQGIQQGYETRLGIQSVGNQLNQCCCDLRSDLAGINYNLATQATGLANTINSGFCETNRGIERGFADVNYGAATNATAIIQNQHNDTDRVIAKLNEMEATRQQEKIAQLTAENQRLAFAASQTAQNAYLTDVINSTCPKPQPAYMVANPNGPLNYTVSTGCNCGGCGC